MDSLSYLLAEESIKERQREVDAITKSAAEAHGGRSLRHTLAATFVRVGLRLDATAGEGLPAFDVTFAGEKGGC